MGEPSLGSRWIKPSTLSILPAKASEGCIVRKSAMTGRFSKWGMWRFVKRTESLGGGSALSSGLGRSSSQGFCPFDESPHPPLGKPPGHRRLSYDAALRCLRRQDAQSRRLYPTRSQRRLSHLSENRGLSRLYQSQSLCRLRLL